MKALLALSAAALIAGCAAPPTIEQLRETAQGLPIVRLCAATIYQGPPYSTLAGEELQRRGIPSCDPYRADVQQFMALQQADQQQRRAAAMQIYQQMQANRPQPPQSVNCTSYRLGDTVQTNCR
jgi:Asp/Glu/hydantoin racemase